MGRGRTAGYRSFDRFGTRKAIENIQLSVDSDLKKKQK